MAQPDPWSFGQVTGCKGQGKREADRKERKARTTRPISSATTPTFLTSVLAANSGDTNERSTRNEHGKEKMELSGSLRTEGRKKHPPESWWMPSRLRNSNSSGTHHKRLTLRRSKGQEIEAVGTRTLRRSKGQEIEAVGTRTVFMRLGPERQTVSAELLAPNVQSPILSMEKLTKRGFRNLSRPQLPNVEKSTCDTGNCGKSLGRVQSSTLRNMQTRGSLSQWPVKRLQKTRPHTVLADSAGSSWLVN